MGRVEDGGHSASPPTSFSPMGAAGRDGGRQALLLNPGFRFPAAGPQELVLSRGLLFPVARISACSVILSPEPQDGSQCHPVPALPPTPCRLALWPKGLPAPPGPGQPSLPGPWLAFSVCEVSEWV